MIYVGEKMSFLPEFISHLYLIRLIFNALRKWIAEYTGLILTYIILICFII